MKRDGCGNGRGGGGNGAHFVVDRVELREHNAVDVLLALRAALHAVGLLQRVVGQRLPEKTQSRGD